MIGHQAGKGITTSTEYGTYVGMTAGGTNDHGNHNTFIGGNAGGASKAATTETTGIGQGALSGVSGASNTAVGYAAANATNTAVEITAVGHATLRTVTGSYNTAIGKGVMGDGAGDGAYNTGVGTRAYKE